MNITNGTGPVSISSTLPNVSITNLNDLKQQQQLQQQQMNSSNNWPLNPPQNVPNQTSTTSSTVTVAPASTTTSSSATAASTTSIPLQNQASAPQNESKFRIIKTDTNVNRSTDAELTDSSVLTGLIGGTSSDDVSYGNNVNMLNNTNTNVNTSIANNVSTNNGANGATTGPMMTNGVDTISHQQYQRGRWRVTDYTPEQPIQTNNLASNANISLQSNSESSTNTTLINSTNNNNTSNNNPSNGTLIGNSSVGNNLNGLISSKLNQPQATQSNTSITSNQFDASYGAHQQLKHINSSVSLAGSLGVSPSPSTVTAATSLQQLPTPAASTNSTVTNPTTSTANVAQSTGNLTSTSTANFGTNMPPLATQSQINLPSEYIMQQATNDVNAQTNAYQLLNNKNIGSLPTLVVQSSLPIEPGTAQSASTQYMAASQPSNLITLQKQTSVVGKVEPQASSATTNIPPPVSIPPVLTSQTSPKEQSLIKNLNQPTSAAVATSTNTNTSTNTSLQTTAAPASTSVQNQPAMSFLMSPLANSTNIIDNAGYANSNTNSINELAKDFISDLSSDNDRKTMIDSGIHMRIEQAMDMVKSHLTTAVRSEIVALKNQIKQLKEMCTRLEQENTILRQHASPDTLKLIENRNILNQSANSTTSSTSTSIQSNMNTTSVGQANQSTATSGTSSPAPVNFEPITKSLPHEATMHPQQQPVLNGPGGNPLGNELGMHDSMISSFTEHVVANNAYSNILSQTNVMPDQSSLNINHQLDSSNDF